LSELPPTNLTQAPNSVSRMSEGATSAALVVGIDRYDIGPTGLRPLSGAVADAAAAVAWLQALDVPNERIFLHASPVDAPAAVATGVAVRAAREQDVWGSAYRISRLSGSRLFIFLFGHAVFEPRWKRLFFTQEFGVNDNWANLSIDRHIDYFLSTNFRRQFLFMDGCNNLPYPEDARGRFRAGFLGGEDVTPRAQNCMVACFSCSQSEVSAEIGGRGLFTRHLLEALAPASPLADALQLDWTTGEQSVDITLAMAVLKPLVTQEAATAPGGQLQHPDYRLEGFPAADRPTIMHLPGEAFRLDVHLDPAADVPMAVRQVEVEGEVPPYWTLRWAPGGSSAAPTPARLPKGLATHVVCWVNDGWRCEPGQVRLMVDTDQSLLFRLGTDGEAGAPGGWVSPTPDTVEIHRLFAHRHGIGDWYGTPYGDAARTLGMSGPPVGGTGIDRGITIFEHESGPEFHVKRSARRRASTVVRKWWTALDHVTPTDVTYRLEVIETNTSPAEPAQVRLEVPPGGAVRLAGPLADQRVVHVGPAGADRSGDAPRSPRELELEPLITARPGPIRVAVELPWGSWSRVVHLSDHGLTRVALPAAVGLPPLRTILASELSRATGDTLAIGTSGSRPVGWVQTGLFDTSKRRLRAGRRGGAAWSLIVPDLNETRPGPMPLVSLASGVRFPVMAGRAFGVEATRRVLRVEPLSPVPTPLWDVLVTTGRLDSLDRQERNELTSGKWEDPILGVAAAYAIYMTGDRRALDTVLETTRSLLTRTPVCDLDLLEITASHPRGGRLRTGEADRLDRLAMQGAVPAFRWGVPLALDLAARARKSHSLGVWSAALRQVEERFSPLSIWTIWQAA
jgi:hypothetical protein